MTARSQSTRRKLSLLQLAEELRNVSKVCRVMGYHCDTFYEVRRAFQVGGVNARVEKARGPQSPHPNRVEPEVEEKILVYALDYPTHGQQRVANELRLKGLNVSPTGVRSIWLRHGLETRHRRLLRLEQHVQQDTYVLSEEQIELFEHHSADFRCRHVEASRPGELLNQDTFYWGTLKGVGKVYVQGVVDVFARWPSRRSTPRRCRSRHVTGSTNGGALLRGSRRQARGNPHLDNGHEFCGKPDSHPSELLLSLEGVEHRTTRVRSPRTNGFVERMNRTLLDECFRVEGRKTRYLTPKEIQCDLDRFLRYYNLERSHQGYRLQDRTPAQALREPWPPRPCRPSFRRRK
jgi:transposase InsO family protein